jgi:CRP-like cAMP-binding protein
MRILDLFSSSKVIHYKKGQMILRADEVPTNVFYIIRGFVKIYSVTPTGEEKLLIIYKAGEIFPLVTTITQVENRWYDEALTDCELFRVARTDFLDYLKNNPDTLFEVTNQMSSVLRIFSRRIDILEVMKAYPRIMADILFLAEDFGERQSDGTILINIPITHRDIASRSAVTRETASRELSKLERKRLIIYKNHRIIIKNLEKLKEELELAEV